MGQYRSVEPNFFMTFQFLDNGERLFVFSKDAIIIRFGRNGDKSYALLIGLAPRADDVLEYYFCVVETDLVDVSERIYMSGYETKFIPKEIRPAVLESLVIGTRGLIELVQPVNIFKCCESYLTDKALRKHLLIANLIQEYSYHVEEPPVMSRRRSWWFDRRIQTNAEEMTKVLAQTSDLRRHIHAAQVTARADVQSLLRQTLQS